MSTATWFCTSARSAGVSPTAKSSRAARSATSPGGAFRASCNVFLVVEGDRRILVDAGNGAPRGSLLAKLRADGVDPATNALPAR